MPRRGSQIQHLLLPHERRAAVRALRRYSDKSQVKGSQKVHDWAGPEARSLLAATRIDGLVASGCVLLGGAVLVASGASSIGLVFFYCLICVGFCLGILGLVRSQQRARALRKWQKAL